MSLKTWREEFYPVHASDACRSEIEAAKHSIHKWSGALPENLKKHGVYIRVGDHGADICDEKYPGACFGFASYSCALCQRHDDCDGCSLYDELGGMACSEGSSSPWALWLASGAVHPMLDALRATLNRLEKESENGKSVEK